MKTEIATVVQTVASEYDAQMFDDRVNRLLDLGYTMITRQALRFGDGIMLYAEFEFYEETDE